MSKKKKAIIILVILFIIVAIFIGIIVLYMLYFHYSALNRTLDTSEWQLSNDDYYIEIIDDIQEQAVSFKAFSKDDNKLLYTSEYSVRRRDLVSIELKDNNDIIVDSHDVGMLTYKFDSIHKTWVYDDPYD